MEITLVVLLALFLLDNFSLNIQEVNPPACFMMPREDCTCGEVLEIELERSLAELLPSCPNSTVRTNQFD